MKRECYDLSSVKGRLLHLLKSKRMSQVEFTHLLNVSPTYIGAMRKSIPEEKVLRINEIFPDLNRDWLIYGEGEMLRPSGKSKQLQEEECMLLPYEVPLLPVEAFAGRLQDWAMSADLRQCEKLLSPFKDVDFAIRISGNSMEPNFHDGSTLFIKRINDRAFIPWGHAMVIDTENGVLVKVVYPGKESNESEDSTDYDSFIEARSYNSNYPPIHIPTSCIYGLYRVMGCIQLYPTM